MIRTLTIAGAYALAVVVAVAVTFIRPAELPQPDIIELPHSSKVTCAVAGTALVAGEGAVEVEPVDDSAGRRLTPPDQVELAGPADLRSDSPVAAGVLLADPAAYAPCVAPVASGIVIVPDPVAYELLLVNGDSQEAAVDLVLLGPDGEIKDQVGTRGIALAGGSTRRIGLPALAETGPVGVAFSASHGRVAVLATQVEGRAAQFAAPGTVGTSHLIAGLPGEGTATQLLLSNPTAERIHVSVTALGVTASFAPASTENISIAAQSTIAVDLGADLGGEASALQVTSEADFGAAVVTTLAGGQPTTLPNSALGTQLGAQVPAQAGSLLLTNPGEADVEANVDLGEAGSSSVVVPAGRTVAVPVPETGGAVKVQADTNLAGAVASGSLIVPLAPLAAPEALTGTAVLDATLW